MVANSLQVLLSSQFFSLFSIAALFYSIFSPCVVEKTAITIIKIILSFIMIFQPYIYLADLAACLSLSCYCKIQDYVAGIVLEFHGICFLVDYISRWNHVPECLF